MKIKKLIKNHIDIFTIIFVLSLFWIIVELKHPYFFFSDDNRTFYFPFFMHNYRSLLNGEIPLFNFHQYLGIPHFSNFQSAIFNPLIYISIFLSNLFFGHGFFAMDIAVIINIIIGAVGFYLLVNLFLKNKFASIYGAIVWSLSSFGVFVSDSWWILSGVIAYFPFMLYFGFRLYKHSSVKNLMFLIFVRLCLFYTGHIEYFIYSMIFEFLTVTVVILLLNYNKDKIGGFFKKYSFSYLFTLIYSLPILLPGWIQTKSSALRAKHLKIFFLRWMGFPLKKWLLGLINPFKVPADFYNRSRFDFFPSASQSLSYIGFVSIFMLVVLLVYLFKKKNFNKYSDKFFIIFILFIISFIWSLGMFAGVIFYIPILNRFRFPFKLYEFANFFLILLSTWGFYVFITHLKLRRKKAIAISLIVLTLVNFYFLYTTTYVSFNNIAHQDKLPLEEPYKNELKDGRIFSLGIYLKDPFSISTLGFNYATLLDLNHFAGYDPLVPKSNFVASLRLQYRSLYDRDAIPISYLRKWGVKYYVFSKSDSTNEISSFLFNKLMNESEIDVFKSDLKRIIFKDNTAKPMVYWDDFPKSDNIVDIKVHTNYLEITMQNKKKDTIIVNYLFNNYFQAFLNNKPIPIEKTDIGQMKFLVPKGNNKLIIKYINPYLIYSLIIVIIISLILLIWWVFAEKKRKG